MLAYISWHLHMLLAVAIDFNFIEALRIGEIGVVQA